MRSLRTGPVILGVSSLLVVAGIAAAFGGLPGERSASNRGTSVSTQADEGGSGECPSAEEIRAYWKEYGKDLKPAGTCGDPDPLPPGDGTGEAPSNGPPPPTPTTLAEAQAMLDPDDDPLMLLRQDDDGRWSAILVAMAPNQDPPPPNIRTVDQFAAWLDVQSAD
jgi:hypothetical protein